MTPHQKTVAKRWAAIGALLLPGLGYALKVGASTVDARFVHTDDFRLIHQRDSLVYDAKLTRIDTSLGALVRDCRRRGGCSP